MRPDDLYVDADVAIAKTLPASWYVDPAALAFERRRVFGSTWQYATSLDRLGQPGSYVALDIVGSPVVVVRDKDGTLRAFHNVCRHRAGPVARGAGSCQALKCAYHGWTYGLDGALRFTPEMTGVQCFDKEAMSLSPVGVTTVGPMVFVRLGDVTPTAADFFATIPDEIEKLGLDRLKFYERRVYEINCNWKVYVDNYLEGYHIPQVHPGLFKELSYPDYKVETARYHSKQFAPIRNPGASLYKRSLAEGAAPEALYYWVFPNLMLNIYPDNLQVNVIVPLGHERTATIFEWYLLDPDRPETAREFAESLAFSDVVQKEDIDICEDVQRGLASGSYEAGRFSPIRENGLHHFHRLMVEFLRRSSP